MCRKDKLITQGTKAGLKRTTICTHVDIFVSVHLSEGGVTFVFKVGQIFFLFYESLKVCFVTPAVTVMLLRLQLFCFSLNDC